MCALFPVLLADSLHVESALSLTKYCFTREAHFQSKGSSSEVLQPVYVPTFHLHAVYLGKLRKECLPFSLSVFVADRIKSLVWEISLIPLYYFYHLFRVSCGDLSESRLLFFFQWGSDCCWGKCETLNLTCDICLMGYLIPQPHGLIRKENDWFKEIINWTLSWFMSYSLIKVGESGGVLDLKLSWGTLSICSVHTDFTLSQSYGFD